MGKRLRCYEPRYVTNGSIRTVDRQFLFTPNHHPDYPLLHRDCPPHALDLNNDIEPIPSIINIIGASIGIGLKRYPCIKIHWAEGNITHLHKGNGNDEEIARYIADFKRDVHSRIARMTNKLHDREGPVFSGSAREESCRDDVAAEQKMIYALTNTVKDGLIDTVLQSPFFSTYRHQITGEPIENWYIDYRAFYKKGGYENKKHSLKDYLKWVKWSVTPLPAHEKLTVHQRQTRIRKLVQEQEAAIAAERKQQNKTAMGVDALMNRDPRDRPKTKNKQGPQPFCHATDPETAKAFRRQWHAFMNEHRKASWDFRGGMWDRPFPEFSFRPPIIKPYISSAL